MHGIPTRLVSARKYQKLPMGCGRKSAWSRQWRYLRVIDPGQRAQPRSI